MKLRAGNRWVECEVTGDERHLYVRSPYNKHLLAELRAMEGARWQKKERVWKVKASRRNQMQLAILAGETPFELEPYRQPVHHHPSRRSCLWSRQRRMLDFVLSRKGCVIAADMAAGKTLVAIEVMEANPGEWLYVGPTKALAAVKLEFLKWHAEVTPAFCTYAGLRRLVECWPEGRTAPRGVIFDESQHIKGPNNKTCEAAQHLADAIREDHGDEQAFVVCMSGTPQPKNPVDWWRQIEVVRPGLVRESSGRVLERRLGVFEQMEAGGRVFQKRVGWVDEECKLWAKRIAPAVHVERVTDLPDLKRHRLDLEPSPSTIRAAQLILSTASGAPEALNRLRQLSDGFQYDEGKTRRGETPKDDAVRDLLQRYPNRGVFYAAFTASVDRVVQLCKEAGRLVIRCDGRGWQNEDLLIHMQDEELVRGKGLVFVGQPGAGGTGLNMQGSRFVCFYSNDFNGGSRAQAEARIRRYGIKWRPKVYDLAHLAVDDFVLKNHKLKRTMQQVTFEEIEAMF